MEGWYFAQSNNCLRYGDNRGIVIGETHTVDITEKQLEMCEWGLHASKRVIDALKYAPGPMVYRVKLSGKVLHQSDKSVAEHRTYLWGYDATDVLLLFARRCALDVVHLWDAPQVVIDYLKTGDEKLRTAARAAAWAAVRAAAGVKQNRRLTSMIVAGR